MEEKKSIAVYVDYDNIEIGVKSTLRREFNVGITLDALRERGDLVAKFAYDDTVYTSVETIPSSFSVSTPYPNPFNPVTTIEYSLPHETQVKLEIFSVTGQKVAQLEDRVIQSGSHSVDWDASGMPSGIYLYKFTAGEFARRDKMLLLK